MLEIVVCDDDIADLERAVNMLHKIFTSQKIAYHIEQFASANQMLENISNIDIGILDISMEELNGIKCRWQYETSDRIKKSDCIFDDADVYKRQGDVYGKMLVLTFEDNEDAMMNRILSLINTKEVLMQQ